MSKIRHDTVTRRVEIRTDTPDNLHHCLAGPACRSTTASQPDPTTGKISRTPATTEKPNTVCRRCYSAIRLAVEELPQDYQDLHAALGEHQHLDGEKVRSSPTPPSPLDLTKDDLMGEITKYLHMAAARITATPPAGLRPCAEIILKHLDKLITSPALPEEEWCGRGESVPVKGENGKVFYRPDTRIIERTGVDTAMKLIDLRSRARARVTGITTGLWRLPVHFPGCMTCGEVLYTNGHKVVCRACDRDWTEQTAGLFNAHIKRQAQIEREQMIEELKTQLAEAITQRDSAWETLDRVAVLAEAVYTPDYDQISKQQFADLLTEIVAEHPTPETRAAEAEPEPEAAAS